MKEKKEISAFDKLDQFINEKKKQNNILKKLLKEIEKKDVQKESFKKNN